MKLRLGIIGAGNIAATHVQNVLEGKCPDIEITAVADRKESRRRWAQEKLPGAAIYCEGSELIAARPCDAVLIAVPHYQHPPLAIEAFRAGLHVMCEKPAGVYTLQVREMMAEADRHPELTFGMMFNQRTNCVYRKIKELLDAGELGQIKRVNWIVTDWYRTQFYYDSGAWRATWAGEGGGVLLNQCPHQLDLWQWICGMPKRVQAHLSYGLWHDIEVEDDVTTFVEYENGATGVFVTTTGDAHGTNRFEIQMDGAKLVAEDGRLKLLEYEQLEPEWTKTNTASFATVPCREVEVELDGENPQHVGVINAWGGAILRGEPLVADGREGIQGLTLSNAMHLSAFRGRAVEIPFDEDAFYDELMRRAATSRYGARKAAKAVFSDVSGTYGGNR